MAFCMSCSLALSENSAESARSSAAINRMLANETLMDSDGFLLMARISNPCSMC